MVSTIAKKYAQALIAALSTEELKTLLVFLKSLGLALKNKQIADLLTSPFLSKTQKESVMLACANHTNQKVQNFLKVLIASDRLMMVSHIAYEVEKKVFEYNKEYIANLSSKEKFDGDTLNKIQESLAKKLNVRLNIHQRQDFIDGIKLEIEDLGIEISFSEQRFGDELKKHILKAL